MKLPHLLILISLSFLLSGCAVVRDWARETAPFNNPSPQSPPSRSPALPNRDPENEDAPSSSSTGASPSGSRGDGNSGTGSENTPATQTAAQNSQAGSNSPPTDNSACTSGDKGGTCCDFPHWINTARSFLGTHEGSAKAGESKQVLEFHKHSGFQGIADANKYKTYSKDAAWCGSFVNWCMTKTNNPKTKKVYPNVKASYRAKNWKSYGKSTEPCFGAIMVIGNSHVTFCVGKTRQKKVTVDKKTKKKTTTTREYYVGLGGNQGNMVKYSPYNNNLTFRLPEDYKPCKEHFNLDSDRFIYDYASLFAENSSAEESTR